MEVVRERMWWWMSMAAIFVSALGWKERRGRTGDHVVGEDGEGGDVGEGERDGSGGLGKVFVGGVGGGGEAEGDG